MMIEKNEIVNTFIDHAMAVSDDFNAYAKVGGGNAAMTWDQVDIPITKCIELIYNAGETPVLDMTKPFAPKRTEP